METPEHDKLNKIAEQSQHCGEFLDWLLQQYTLCITHKHAEGCYDEDGRTSCGCREDGFEPSYVSIAELLARFFDIDTKRLEEEKTEMLAELRRTPRGDNP